MSTSLVVFAPAVELVVDIDGNDPGDIEIHAGGQGAWVARMSARLGCEVELCAPYGGPTGEVIKTLCGREGLHAVGPDVPGANGVWIVDKRRGQEIDIVATGDPTIDRHGWDDLHNLCVVRGLEAGTVVLTGCKDPRQTPDDLFSRLATDLAANGVTVVADLSGEQLHGALEGGIDVLKISHTELESSGFSEGEDEAAIVEGIDRLRRVGARDVVVSRSSAPTLATRDGEVVRIEAPSFEPLEEHGAGDAMTGALAVATARHLDPSDRLALGAAAGALNAARKGYGTGRRDAVEALARNVSISPTEVAS